MTGADRGASGPVRPKGWLWRYRPSPAVASFLDGKGAGLAARLGGPIRCIVAGGVVGAVPLLAACATGWPLDRPVTAALLLPLLLAAVLRDSLPMAAAAIGSAFAAHSALALGLAGLRPDVLAAVFPDGREYWATSYVWITTGVCPDYDLGFWLPYHLQLLAGVVAFGYTSLGFIPFWRGLYEVDLMNFYVGRLAAHSRSPWTALAIGWHPWSVCRGIGFFFLVFEVASFSSERLIGRPLSAPSARRFRWAAGLSFLALDAVLKVCFLDVVRKAIGANLA